MRGDHDNLSRGAAQRVLRLLIDNESMDDALEAPTPVAITIPDSVPHDSADLYRDAFGPERDLIAALAEAGVPQPEVGFESAGGIPISVAWPDRTIAADNGLNSHDRADLEAEGWTVLPLEGLVAVLARAE